MFVCLFAITYVATKYRRRQKKPQKKCPLSPVCHEHIAKEIYVGFTALLVY